MSSRTAPRSQAIIEATKDVAVAYKPNAAFFEALGAKGAEALEKVVAAVPEGILVLLDAKRGDIGSTAAAYATAAFVATKAHAITGSPYMGSDSLEPLLADATKARARAHGHAHTHTRTHAPRNTAQRHTARVDQHPVLWARPAER